MIGVGSGVSYSTMVKTHFNLDDLNLIYTLRNIIILNPANVEELEFIFNKFINYKKPIYFRINKNSYKMNRSFKKKNNIFFKKGTGKNVVVSGTLLNYLLNYYDQSEINKMNIISLPILNHKYNKNILSLLNQNDTLLIVDSSKFIYFQDLENKINILNKRFKCVNFDFDHNNIKSVGNEIEILNDMGFKKSFLDKFFLKN